VIHHQVYFVKINLKHQINPNKEPNHPPLPVTKSLATRDPLANSPTTVTFFIFGQTQPETPKNANPTSKIDYNASKIDFNASKLIFYSNLKPRGED
jgi:hypothetical protein